MHQHHFKAALRVFGNVTIIEYNRGSNTSGQTIKHIVAKSTACLYYQNELRSTNRQNAGRFSVWWVNLGKLSVTLLSLLIKKNCADIFSVIYRHTWAPTGTSWCIQLNSNKLWMAGELFFFIIIIIFICWNPNCYIYDYLPFLPSLTIFSLISTGRKKFYKNQTLLFVRKLQNILYNVPKYLCDWFQDVLLQCTVFNT